MTQADTAQAEAGQRTAGALTQIGTEVSINLGSALAGLAIPIVGSTLVVAVRQLVMVIAVAPFYRPRRASFAWRRLYPAILLGIDLAIMNLAFYQSVHLLGLGIAATIEFLGPLTLALVLSRRLLDFVCVAVAALGVLALTGIDGEINLWGVTLALIAAAAWAGYILLTRRVALTLPGLEGLTVASAVSFLIIAPLAVTTLDISQLSWPVIALLVGIGVLSSADPHRQFRRQRRINNRREQIVQRGQPRALRAVQDREILAVRVGIADHQIEDHRIQQPQHIHRRPHGKAPHQRETILQRRAALAGIFRLAGHTERLTEILLVNPPHAAVREQSPIVSRHQQKGPAPDNPSLDRGHIQPGRRRQPHDERLVLRRRRKVRHRRLQDMSRRLTRHRQRNGAVDQNHGHLRLRTGQGKPQPILPSQQRPDGQPVQNPYQLILVQCHRLSGRSRCWRLARRQKLQRPGDIPAQPIQQREIVPPRHPKRSGRGVALRFLGQQTAKERPALPAGERFHALW